MGTIPALLQKSPVFKNLMLLATIADNYGVIQWAIFFSKDAGVGGLWLIPITNEANDEATLSSSDTKLVPNIICSELVLRNATTKKFWYEDEAQWQNDSVLILAPDTQLEKLNNTKGKWQSAVLDKNHPKWNYWRTSGNFNNSDQIIVFPAPKCYIANQNGGYDDYKIWLGVRDKTMPFIALDKDGTQTGEDCPVIWYDTHRYADLLIHKNNEPFNAENFYNSPLSLFNYIKGNIRPRASEFLTVFNDKYPVRVNAWVITADNSGKYISICYVKHKEVAGFDLVYAIIFQNCLKEKNQLITKALQLSVLYKKAYNLITKTRDGINSVLASNPMALVPHFTDTPVFNISENISYVSEWVVSYADPCNFEESFTLIKSLFYDGNAGDVSVPKTSIKLNLKDIAGNELKLDKVDISTKIDTQQTNDNGTLLRCQLADYDIESNKIIDGSFEFEINTKDKNKTGLPKQYGELRLTLQNRKTQRPIFLWQPDAALNDIALQFSIEEFSLPVSNVMAAGQDLLATERFVAPGTVGGVVEGGGERDEAPLIIPLPQNKVTGKYYLTFSESVNIAQDYRLDIKLQETNPQANVDNSTAIRAVILDTSPNFIGLLNARFLQQPGYDDGAWVLARRSQLSAESGAWEILDDSANSEGFKLVLPAQAIGEAYVKNAEKDAPPAEPKAGKAIEFKFGAPAMFRIANERLERRYVAPPWNLRHIWGQPGNELPGVPLLEKQFELLYGLTGYLKPADTNIAELASKLGEIPVPPANSIFWQATKPQKDVFASAWQEYLRFYRAWRSRLAILEPSKEKAFENARFTDGLKYAPRIDFKPKLLLPFTISKVNALIKELEKLEQDAQIAELIKQANELSEVLTNRLDTGKADKALKDAIFQNNKTKDIAAALSLFERVGASLKYPIANSSVEIPENGQLDPVRINDLDYKIAAAHDIDGLAGGFHYGFESEAIYNEFWREAFKGGSSSAVLEAPAYSSLGGWGKQTARFAGDKTVIKSTTTMGRTHFYAVERIGRIGVLWHKAKHVIEYERTVVPSVYAEGQPILPGRPIVRKVREYVEILEPIKNYPDYPNQSDDAPGTIKACHFKSLIIPVRGSWGRDVTFKDQQVTTNYGWEIPLWQPDADPKLFPKPQVAFELIAPANSNVDRVMVNLSEPQNLWFYTDTREKVDLSETATGVMLTADTSLWPAIKYVDYTNLPAPTETHLAPTASYNSGKGMEQIMPDILKVAPGFERFTFIVDKSELPAGVANRYNPRSGISGKLTAVTMMRKPALQPKQDHDAFKALVTAPDSIINKIYNGELTHPDNFENIAQNILGADLKNKINTLNADIVLNQFQTIYANGSVLKNTFSKYLWKETVSGAEGLLNKVLATYNEYATIFFGEVSALIKQGGYYKNDAIATMNRYKDRIGTIHSSLEYGIEQFASARKLADTALNSVRPEIENKKTDILNFIDQEAGNLQQLINSPVNDLQQYRTNAADVLSVVIKKSSDLISSVSKIKLPDDKLKNILKGVVQLLENLKSAAEDLNNKLPTYSDIDAIKVDLNIFKTNAEAAVTSCAAKIDELTTEIEAFVNRQFDSIQAALTQLNKSVKDGEQDIINTIDNLTKAENEKWENGEAITIDAVTKLIEDVKQNLILADTGSFKALISDILYQPGQGIDSAFGIVNLIDGWLNNLEQYIQKKLIETVAGFAAKTDVQNWLDGLAEYKKLADAIRDKSDEIAKASVALANKLSAEFGQLAGDVADKVKELDQAAASFNDMRNSGKQVLDNYRSVWEEFTAPGMGLNRKTIASIVNKDWSDVEQRLSITPCISRVKQFENDLEGLGLRLPVTNIFEGLLPPKPEWVKNAGEYGKSLLDKFNFSDVLSDIGAMRLDKLFPNFKMPNNLRDNIKLTQGFDKQNLMAWANVEIDFKLDAPQSVISIGPIELRLNQGRFIARVRMEMDIEGNTKKQNSGMLAGDWETHIGGVAIMTFKDAKAIFEGDKLSFDLDPSRMEMPGLLKLLTDATKNIPTSAADTDDDGSNEPFKIGLLEVDGEVLASALKGKRVPVGVKASLDTPPINIGGGTTSITGLCFGGHFMLSFFDTDRRQFDFMTGLGFYLGKQGAPFNITVFFLGGGGYIDSKVLFKPEEGLSVTFIMSVHASLGFAITLGWMTGSVVIMLGLEGEYHKAPGSDSGVYVSIFVQVVGLVDILGLISVYLGLRLAATYTGSQLIGKGQVVLRIKICWCLTISVNKQYEKTFVGSGGNDRQLTSDKPRETAVKILNTLC